MKRLFQNEIQPHLERVKERRKKRGLKNTLYDYREREKLHYKTGSRTLIVLVKAGISYQRACEIIKR